MKFRCKRLRLLYRRAHGKRKLVSFSSLLNRIFIIILLVPVLLLGGLSMYYSFAQKRAQRSEEARNLIRQSQQAFNDVFSSCGNSLRYLAANSTLLNFFLIDEQDYLQISRDAKTIRALFYNTMTTNPYCDTLTLYSPQYQTALSGFIEPPPAGEAWYSAALASDSDYWFIEGDTVFIARKLISAYYDEPLGVFCMKLKPSALKNNIKSLDIFPFSVSIQNSGETIWEYQSDTWDSRSSLNREFLLEVSGWTLHYRVSFSNYSTADFAVFFPFALLLATLLLMWGITHFFSKKLSTELTLLVADVKKAQGGNLDIRIHSSQISEISFLSESIQTFLTRIKNLIHQVYSKEIQRQNLELNLLRAKINPHFLYNNLSMINWLALSSGQEEISVIATELSDFYRTALNKGKDVDRLSIELKNVKSYLSLQLIAHRHSFDVVYDCPQELMDCKILLFIIQPLVENAIEHGIDQTPDIRGVIRIHISRREEWLTIRVSDNGARLYEKIGCSSLPHDCFGYGTENVHRRIQLFYGEDSGLTISASKEGTTSEIRFRYLRIRHKPVPGFHRQN